MFPANCSLVLQPLNFSTLNDLQYVEQSWDMSIPYVNVERFAGLNFHSFQEYRESFVCEYLFIYNIIALFKYFKRKALRRFSHEKLHWVESVKVEPSESFHIYVS